MGYFTVHADFNKIDGGVSITKSLAVSTNVQVVGPGGVIYDNTSVTLEDGVLQVQLPANDVEPNTFGYTFRRPTGLTKTWRVPAQAPGATVELTDFTATTPLPLPASGNAVSQTAFEAYQTSNDEAVSTIQDAFDALVTGAPGALDTLNELAAALGDDASFATTVTNALGTKVNSSTYTTGLAGKQALQQVAATVSASGAAVVNKHNPVDATGAARSISLPTGQAEGTQVSIEKVDSSTNTVSITGNIRGVAASSISLTYQSESLMLRADSSGSWWPIAGHRTKAALDLAYGPRKALVSDLTFPLAIPHRGAGRSDFPEGNIDTYLVGASQFGCTDGGDLRLLGDGTLFDFHDADMSVFSFARGNVYSLTGLAEAKQLTPRVPAGFPATTARQFTDWDEISGRLGGKVVLFPEIKGDTSPWPAGTQGQAVADRIVAQGLTKSVVVGSYYLADLVPCIDAGIECAFWPLGDASTAPAKASAVAARAAGCTWVALAAGPSTGKPADLPDYLAMGFTHVGVATINRRSEWAAWQAAGCTFYYSNSPVYTRGRASDRLSATNFQTGVFHSGMLPSTDWQGDRGSIANCRWTPKRWPTGPQMTLMGRFQPATPSTFTWGLNVCFDALGSDLTRHADLGISTTDDYFSPSAPSTAIKGYVLAFRMTAANQMQLWKVDNGVFTSLGVATGSLIVAPPVLSAGLVANTAITSLPVNAIPADIPSGTKFALPTAGTTGKSQIVTTTALASAGATTLAISSVTPSAAVASGTLLPQSVPLTVQVTSTQIIVTRTDTGASLTVTDSTTRGAYLHAGLNDNAGTQTGLTVSYGDMTIT
jgi:hypothetical protein